MKGRLIATVVVIMASVYCLAGDTPWQLDKAKISKMSVSELDAAADVARAQKDYAGAVRLLQEATRKQPKDSVLFNKLGVTELQLRDIAAASGHFKKSIRLNPKYADALNNLGAAYFMQNDYDKAARYYRKALALEETRATFHANLATVWLRQNKLNLALTEYARAMELDPDVLTTKSTGGSVAQVLTPEQRASRFFLLARVCAIRGDIDCSIDYLKKAKDEGYRDLKSVYKQQEFAKLWQDPRLGDIVPPR